MSYTGGGWKPVAVPMPAGASKMGIRGLASLPATGMIWVIANATTGPVVLTDR